MKKPYLELPELEVLRPGHSACAGCGMMQSVRLITKILGKRIIIVDAANCFTTTVGIEATALDCPLVHCLFESAASTAAGVKFSRIARKDFKTEVVALAGDGGTFDIGLQALSSVAERNIDIIYICYDNEAYMNTGIQRSSATPQYAWTMTTPRGELFPKKDIIGILASHRVPYLATLTIGYLKDFVEKVQKVKEMKGRGLRFLHVLAACPPGWKTEENLSVGITRLAVRTGVFPLYEVFNGEKYVINEPRPEDKLVPIKEYLKVQGRFSHLDEETINKIQNDTLKNWRRLLKLAALS